MGVVYCRTLDADNGFVWMPPRRPLNVLPLLLMPPLFTPVMKPLVLVAANAQCAALCALGNALQPILLTTCGGKHALHICKRQAVPLVRFADAATHGLDVLLVLQEADFFSPVGNQRIKKSETERAVCSAQRACAVGRVQWW